MVKRRFVRLVISVSLVTLCWQASASGSVTEQADRLVDAFVDQACVAGGSVAVSVGGKIRYHKGFGVKNRETGELITPSDTQFRVGSVSKSMTAFAMARLMESNSMDIDLPVQTYVPSFPQKAKGEVTSRLLAGHLAGIRHYQGREFLSDKYYSDVLSSLAIFKDDPLMDAPGVRYRYSSYGWNLLSAAVEGAAKEPFLKHMQKAVFDPLKMANTGAEHSHQTYPNKTQYYQCEQGKLEAAPFVDNSIKWAGGGFISTTDDVIKFAHEHLAPTLVKRETLQGLFRPMQDGQGNSTHYGLGWRSGKYRSFEHIGHSGGSVGGTAMLILVPEHHLAVALLTNTSRVRFDDLHLKLADLFIENQ